MSGSPLDGQLRSLGFDVRAAGDAAEAERLLAAVPAGDRVALVDARFVGHPHALRLALTDPRFPLSGTTGALTAEPAARPALVRALGETGRDATAGSPPGNGGGTDLAAAPRTGALPDQVAAALDAAGADVHRAELGSLVAAVPEDDAARAEAGRAVDAVDDEAVRLRSAVKARDGFFTTYFVSSYSRYIARWCARRGLTPNQVTTASLITAVIAAACAATGTRGGYIAAGALLYCSFVLDCTDGQLARYSLQYSTLGAWLDATFDRAKEYAYYAGLALGAAHGGGGADNVWALALGAMVLQTCRHVVDFSFNEAYTTGAPGAPAAGAPTAALSSRLDSVGWTVWARRMIVLPIGERWALIAVLTAVTTPRITFIVLLVGCAFAACYTTAGRVLRSVLRRAPRAERGTEALGDLADSGPLARAVAALLRRPARRLPSVLPFLVALAGGAVLAGTVAYARLDGPWPVVAALVYVVTAGLAVARPLTGPLDWLVPPVFRAAEYGTVLLLAARSEVNGALPAAFGLVAAVAYHHYDTTYRIRGGTGAPPRALVLTLGGHETRTLLVVALTAALVTRATDLTVAFTVLAVAVALVALFESIRFWVSSSAPAVHDEGEAA